MSEVRVWSVARTENQLKQNMLGVDPASDGLVLYYKLDGSETQEGGVIKDATGRLNGTTSGVTIETLPTPIAIAYIIMSRRFRLTFRIGLKKNKIVR